MAVARITSKGHIAIPTEVRDRLGVAAGDSLQFDFEGDRLGVRPVKRRSMLEYEGLFRVDLALPTADERRTAYEAIGRWNRVLRGLGAPVQRNCAEIE